MAISIPAKRAKEIESLKSHLSSIEEIRINTKQILNPKIGSQNRRRENYRYKQSSGRDLVVF